MLTSRDDNVREYLRDIYGTDPWPLRSYLTQAEAKDLTAQSVMGRSVFSDMNITGYGGRHRQAVEDSIREGLDPKQWAFWHAARQDFLELGGCYKDALAPSF